jgi:lipopolysaccharide transport system ATP-binding protein
VVVNGKIGALLELGAGFNPEFTGRENVYLAAAVMGFSGAETDALYESIVEFSGIREFIDQPVKTYSSGMYVRLAFSIATSANPDILVIDEALSVGDGAFAKKSFERIMQLKAQGTTVLFCSHSMYQVESFCDRASVARSWAKCKWKGPRPKWWRLMQTACAKKAESGNVFFCNIGCCSQQGLTGDASTGSDGSASGRNAAAFQALRASPTLKCVDGKQAANWKLSLQSDVSITVKFESDPALALPHFCHWLCFARWTNFYQCLHLV